MRGCLLAVDLADDLGKSLPRDKAGGMDSRIA